MNPASVCFPVKIHPHGCCEKQFQCVNASGESNLNLTMFVLFLAKAERKEKTPVCRESLRQKYPNERKRKREMLTSPVRPVTPSWVVPILITSLS